MALAGNITLFHCKRNDVRPLSFSPKLLALARLAMVMMTISRAQGQGGPRLACLTLDAYNFELNVNVPKS
jgi:hypothetical protein